MIEEKYREVAEQVFEDIPELRWISDPELQDKVAACWASLLMDSPYKRISECEKLPNYDMLAHTRHVIKGSVAIADLMAEFYGQPCNKDILIAAAALHDASAVLEKGLDKKPTPLGVNLIHGQYASTRAWDFGLPPEVCYIIAYHPFTPPHICVNPKNIEFIILTYADISAVDTIFYRTGKPTHLQITKRFYEID